VQNVLNLNEGEIMKTLLCLLLLITACGKKVIAEEGNNPETKPESNISSKTKKVLRNIGRTSMDKSCELTHSKVECEKERLEHQKGTEADAADTAKREDAAKIKKAEKNEATAKLKAKHAIEEKECHEVDGKLQCAGKKMKNKVQEIVK
jgi:hypothetical protein